MEPYEQNEEEEEEEREDPERFENCYMCKKPLPQRVNRRKRFRKCRTCINVGTKKNRSKDPVRFLHNKWRDSKKRRPLPEDDEPRQQQDLTSLEVVRNVYERCGKRSVLSGATDYKRLCVVSKVARPATQDDLAVVTTREAIVLSKKKNDEERLRMFELNARNKE